MSKSQRIARLESHLTNRGGGGTVGSRLARNDNGGGTITVASEHRHMSNVRHESPKISEVCNEQ
jgi:hypothetical protein